MTSLASVTLTGKRLDNREGRLSSQKDSRLAFSAGIENDQGLISSEGLLSISAGLLLTVWASCPVVTNSVSPLMAPWITEEV